ncbi:hypothetical protein KP509_05G002600 [Ceratopteris richardii]|nr:hypothetical protein KP509_05G002600 [Ceratopteris richardii]
MIDGSLSMGMEILHDDKFDGKHGLCACDADDHSANACTKHGLSAVLVNREMDKVEFNEVVLTEDFAKIGEALCRSINESNMHSTSSSDTGIERGSSSVWERDVFSITSDCSEALTSTCTDEHEVRARHHFANLRERTSPNARATTERSFHEDSQRAHVDTPSSPLKTRHIAGSGLNERKSFPRASYKEHHKTGKKFHENARISSPEMHGSTISLGATNGKNNRDVHTLNTSKKVSTRKALGLQYSAERPISHNSSRNNKGKPEADRLPGNSPSSLLMDNSRMMDSLSSPDVRNYAFDEDDSGEDDRRSVHSRMSESSRFSYAKCKERLLSSRTLSEQGPQGGTASLCDKEKSSNYSKFKLKQMGIVDSKMRTSNMDTHVKAGSLKRGSVRRDIRTHVHDVTMAVNAPIHSALDESRDYHDGSGALLDKQGKPFYQRDYQDVQSREGSSSKGGLEEEEPSHLKSTLQAVREKTMDPNFQKFTLQSTLVGGADLLSPIRTSQVFDSFAMVKCSYDPRHDFRESMVEMIMEKGLHTSHDMVELLQCYLTLNAEAYHDTIVKVFTEVWSEMFRHT